MAMDTKELGSTLKNARKSAGLTQKELSFKSGITTRTIQKFEKGQISKPKFDTFYNLFINTGYKPGDILNLYHLK